ncbi:MAG: septal ring lytic transglycosylase RlpA family protein [Gammaproteobacteria bacterium]|nr:septal ring lytic transglycosylase RlpA family protein [Gammaproteobacteria bacterium]
MSSAGRVIARHGCGLSRLCATTLVAAVLAAGCSSTPKTPDTGGRGGGYYLDDGPGSNPPRDLDSIPDAVPRSEPLNRAASRPYSVFGREYVPMSTLAPYKARGVASWYGRRYHGRRTSIGEVYDMYAMSAAHPTLPLPSYVRVTSLVNGRSVIVRVNDRGPFLNNRLIDLSYAAANRLDYIGSGSAMVEVELLIPGQPVTATAPAVPDAAQPAPPGREAPMATTIDASGVFLQIGAFASRDNADLFRDQVARQLPWIAGALRVESAGGLHRVRAGPYRDSMEALAVSGHIREALEVTPIVVR